MCTFHEVQETRSVGTAEAAAQQGDQQGYVAAGGLTGDDARKAAAQDAADPSAGYNPLSKLGIFALQNLPSIGAGKLKNTSPAPAGDPYAGLAIKQSTQKNTQTTSPYPSISAPRKA